MARAGRKRKQIVREPNGRPQRDYANQLAADNQSVVLEARSRQFGISREAAKDARWGHTLGTLQLLNIITPKQAAAGDAYIIRYMRLHKMKGYPRPNPKIAAYAQMIPGYDYFEEPDDEAIAKAKAALDAAQTAMIDALGHKDALASLPAFKKYVLDQADALFCNAKEAGDLRSLLNVLVRHFNL